MSKSKGTWEQRWHPLREEWVIVAAHRGDRPWSGKTLDPVVLSVPNHDPECPLCPRVNRVSGVKNDEYQGVFVFDNDHPCVAPDAPTDYEVAGEPYRTRPATGLSRVICYSPDHAASLATLAIENVVELVECWQVQFRELSVRPEVDHVLIFENRGELVGVSNPHPHCQIYATNFSFKTIMNEAATCELYFEQRGSGLFEDVMRRELEDGRRILKENDTAISFMPYFARYPYELYVAPRRSTQNIAELSRSEVRGFAELLHDAVIRYDNLWRAPFPYVLVLHQAPVDREYTGFHFHAEFHPPLRAPGLLKHLSGPEIGGGNFLNSSCPEEKIKELRSLSERHHLSDGFKST